MRWVLPLGLHTVSLATLLLSLCRPLIFHSVCSCVSHCDFWPAGEAYHAPAFAAGHSW